MTKQKIVIKVSMNNQKLRSKAMTIAAGVSGVEGAAIQGDSKDQIAVTGEQIDSVRLTNLLRKKFGHADLVSVGPAGKTEEKKVEAIVAWNYGAPNYPVYEIRNSYQYEDPSCSIM